MSLLRQVVILIAVVGIALAGGYPLTLKFFGPEGVAPLIWAASGCGIAGLISLIPLAVTCRLGIREYLPQAAFGGMVVRILLTGGYLLVVTYATQVPNWPFTVWLAVFYLILLVVETAMSLSYVKFLEPDGGREVAA